MASGSMGLGRDEWAWTTAIVRSILRSVATKAAISTAALATLVAGAMVLALGRLPSPWDAWRAATCMPADCFCEQIRDTALRQPANSISGLAFVFVGLVVLLTSSSAPVGTVMRGHRAYAALFAATLLTVGVGTVFYHASLSFWGQTADVLGMYLVATFFLLGSAARLHPLSAGHMAVAYVAGNALLLWLLIAVPELRRHVFALLIGIIIALEVLQHRRAPARGRWRYFLGAVGVLTVGFAIWAADRAGIACDPSAAVQGHALWHVAGALAAGLAYLYFRPADPARGEIPHS